MDWAEQASALAQLLPLERLHPATVAELARSTRRVGVACSGGADSTSLLLLLFAHFPELRGRIVVLHFDHQLRGQESTGDADFVKEMAASLGLPCKSTQWEAPLDPSEAVARHARHGFLRASMDHDGLLCFGHNADDAAESLLMRLGRGSSLDGLGGPRPVQRFETTPGLLHLRPLLGVRAAELRDALRSLGVPWREDSSNASGRYTRNRLRNEVLPLLGDILGRDWAAGAARARERIEEADALTCELAHLLIPGPGESLPVAPLRGNHRAVARRALELWLARLELRQSLGPAAFDTLLEAACNARDARGPAAGGVLVLNRENLAFQCEEQAAAPDWGPASIVPGCEVFLPGGASIRASEWHAPSIEAIGEELRPHNHRSACLRLPQGAAFTVRRWQMGDAYRPLGAPGRQLLSDQFINRKIPRTERVRLPVVCVGAVPVWCPGLPPSDDYKLLHETDVAVRLTYLYS
jgi:tRNA(Ile)-lysidine synthase